MIVNSEDSLPVFSKHMFEELAGIVAFLEIVPLEKSKFNFKIWIPFMFLSSMFTGNKVEMKNAIRMFFHTLFYFICLTKKEIDNDQIMAGIASSEGLVSSYLPEY